MTNPIDYVEIARRVIRERALIQENTAPRVPIEMQPESLRDALKGQAVELWSSSSGRLFLVADDEDARLAMEHFGARRGEIYTETEARLIVAVNDPAVVAEIHEWKRQFDGSLTPGDKAQGISPEQHRAMELKRLFKTQGKTGGKPA